MSLLINGCLFYTLQPVQPVLLMLEHALQPVPVLQPVLQPVLLPLREPVPHSLRYNLYCNLSYNLH